MHSSRLSVAQPIATQRPRDDRSPISLSKVEQQVLLSLIFFYFREYQTQTCDRGADRRPGSRCNQVSQPSRRPDGANSLETVINDILSETLPLWTGSVTGKGVEED